jgi:predicted DNA-binding protein YlxM (UPF0122 family)
MNTKTYTMDDLRLLEKTREDRKKKTLTGKETEIIKKYVVDLRSVRQLAKEYGCSKSLIHKTIQQNLNK